MGEIAKKNKNQHFLFGLPYAHGFTGHVNRFSKTPLDDYRLCPGIFRAYGSPTTARKEQPFFFLFLLQRSGGVIQRAGADIARLRCESLLPSNRGRAESIRRRASSYLKDGSRSLRLGVHHSDVIEARQMRRRKETCGPEEPSRESLPSRGGCGGEFGRGRRLRGQKCCAARPLPCAAEPPLPPRASTGPGEEVHEALGKKGEGELPFSLSHSSLPSCCCC